MATTIAGSNSNNKGDNGSTSSSEMNRMDSLNNTSSNTGNGTTDRSSAPSPPDTSKVGLPATKCMCEDGRHRQGEAKPESRCCRLVPGPYTLLLPLIPGDRNEGHIRVGFELLTEKQAFARWRRFKYQHDITLQGLPYNYTRDLRYVSDAVVAEEDRYARWEHRPSFALMRFLEAEERRPLWTEFGSP